MSDYLPQISTRLIAVILVTSFFTSYILVKNKTNHQLIVDAGKLHSVISEPIDYVSTLSIHLGKVITDNNKFDDLNFIDNLFKDTIRLQGSSNNVISWSKFSWGDKKHRFSVNTLDGIMKNRESLADRNYTWRSKYEPWVLQFSKPDVGKMSNTLILPVAVGISNSRDEFMGTVISGINIKELLNRSEDVVKSGGSFILANRDSFNQDIDKIVFISANTPHRAKIYKTIPGLVEKCRDWIPPSGAMPTTLKAGRFKYAYYHIIENYPLVIFVGFNRFDFWIDVLLKTPVLALLFWMIFMIGFAITQEVRKRIF
ncbi:MAG: hypothetical protein V4694_04220 [Pseudomonadota bacterium]